MTCTSGRLKASGLACRSKKRKPLPALAMSWKLLLTVACGIVFRTRKNSAQCALIVTCRNIGRKPKSVLLRLRAPDWNENATVEFVTSCCTLLKESFWRHSWCLYQAFFFIVSFLPVERVSGSHASTFSCASVPRPMQD